MHLAYIDDTSDKDCGLAMIGAILIEDKHFHKVEGLAGMVVEDLLPSEKLNQLRSSMPQNCMAGTRFRGN